MKKISYVNFMRLTILLFVFFTVSCSKEATQLIPNGTAAISVQNGRLAFKDAKTLNATLEQLKRFSINEEASKWEKEYNYTSLRKYNVENRTENRLTEMHLPLSMRMILNENGEYSVGDYIVWFHDGNTHFIEHLDEDQLKRVKSDPSLSKNKASVTTKKDDFVAKDTFSDKHVSGQINAGSDQNRDARYQYQWLMNNQSNDWRKTVYEIYSTVYMVGPSTYGYDNHYTFHLNCKFEWLWHGWQPNANEYHVVQLQFSGWSQPNCTYVEGQTYFSYHENRYTTGDVELILADGTITTNSLCNGSGNLTYSITGYISSDAYDPGNHSVHEVNSGYTTGVGNYPLWE